MKSDAHQTEGYLRGLQGLPWENAPAERPPQEDFASCFLHDVRTGAVALRGRLKKDSQDCLVSFRHGLSETFPESAGKQFAGAVERLWVRWLAALVAIPSDREATAFSFETGRRVGEKLKEEYNEGAAGNLLPYLLDKRLHLGSVRDFLRMRGWLQGTIEFLRIQPDADARERAQILTANFSSIVLRALHNAGPGYAAKTVETLSAMMRHLDQAIRNLATLEPEASRHLRNNRSTIITHALHSGNLDYAGQVAEKLPDALKELNARAPLSNKRTVIYRALTNGRPSSLKIFPTKKTPF